MSTQDILLSLKFNNYDYAPGIATYGIDGKTGQAGIDGNNIYFTNCILTNDAENRDLDQLAILISNNYLPIKGTSIKTDRPYKNSDLFFDENGVIYRLNDIQSLIVEQTHSVYTRYFSIVGKINVTDGTKEFAVLPDGRVILNTSNYFGYDVVTIKNAVDASKYIDRTSAVNIVSDYINENSDIEMIKMQSIDDVDIEDGKLSVYYKTTENAFYLDSNKPIVINGDVKLNNNNNVGSEYDNFSTVLTSNDTVTYFKHICDKLRYNVLYDSSVNRYKLIIYSNEESEEEQIKTLKYLVNRSETVYGKVYDGENNLMLLKLSNIINGPTNSSNYYDYMPDYSLSIGLYRFDSFKFNYKIIENGNEIIHEVEVNKDRIIHNLTDNNGIINIDLSLKLTNNDIGPDADLFDASILNNAFNNNIWGIDIILASKSCASNMIKIDYSHGTTDIVGDSSANDKINNITYTKSDTITSNLFKYVFDPTISNSLFLYIFPLTRTNNDLTTVFDYIYLKKMAPISININIPNDIKNTCTLYFTLNYSEEKFSINNMMLFKQNNLLNIPTTTSLPCIETYLPDSIESVQKFSLLHNTEIFINYQE